MESDNINLEEYFEPVDASCLEIEGKAEHFTYWKDRVDIYETSSKRFPSVDSAVDIAIIGVGEDRYSVGNRGCSSAPDCVRKEFYRLFAQNGNVDIVDLGNMKLGKSVEDTYQAMTEVLSRMIKLNIIPIVIGGSNDIAVGCYRAYCKLSRIINMFDLDCKLDLIDSSSPKTDENYLYDIICSDPNFLFDYAQVGYQSYLVDSRVPKLLDDMHFEKMRLGEVQENIKAIEPVVRDADFVCADMSVIRASDSPCSPSVHGLYGEEFCKIINYAGMSDKLSMLCFTGCNPLNDVAMRCCQITAHSIWYFIDGFLWRKNDYPYEDSESYMKFSVMTETLDEGTEMVFYKSRKSGRWWVEVPCRDEVRIKYMHHYMVPCLYEDYQAAAGGEIPPRWLIAYNKLNF